MLKTFLFPYGQRYEILGNCWEVIPWVKRAYEKSEDSEEKKKREAQETSKKKRKKRIKKREGRKKKKSQGQTQQGS